MTMKYDGSEFNRAEPVEPEFRIAIIGGGPGGLFSAWHLASKLGTTCKITIFEASDRLGGKIVTGKFPGAGLYEAGVAEIYDYSHLGPDPLRDMIQNELGLKIKHIEGGPCILDGHVLQSADDLAEHFGPEVRDAAVGFRAKCADLLSPREFYKSVREADNTHSWGQIPAEDMLANEIENETARRYVRIMSHSDVAAPPHLTNGLNFLKNALMDVDGYLNIYSVVGGNEEIVRCLTDELDAEVRYNTPVRAVQPLADGTYRLDVGTNGTAQTVIADYVIVALPLTALSVIDWRSATLQRALGKHIGYFDRPGHYLRATLLFERPFWREHVQSAWWMLDAFDGCCVYDEGARHDLGPCGALGFLIAGNAALSLANMSDDRIEELCLDALPPCMDEGRHLILDRRIHRWMASVNAIPGGYPVRTRRENHRLDPANLPGIFMVGDYMFDATLNGVLDSADTATDMILADVLVRRRSGQKNLETIVGTDLWSKDASEEVREHFFAPPFIADMLKITWGLEPGARILNIGSGAGTLVGALRSAGFDAFGIENCPLAHKQTAETIREFNLHGEFTKLPFSDQYFDVVIETGLCHLPSEQIPGAIEELRRVTRRGVILGSVTSDLAIDLIERYDFLAGVKTVASRWDWSEYLYAVGFEHALNDPALLSEAWKRAEAAGAGNGHWYEDAESLLYCFYEVGTPAMALSLAAENVDRGEDAAVVALRFAMSLAKGQQR
jgi:monoamine oxidase/SAM-dependent methyltransferase